MSEVSKDITRIAHAVEEAEDAFWASIAASFPEATHGDFPPDLAIDMDNNLQRYVKWWVKYNIDDKT